MDIASAGPRSYSNRTDCGRTRVVASDRSSTNTPQPLGSKNGSIRMLFRHQIITFLTRKGNISPKLQLLSGHAEEKSLAIYRDLALADVSGEYEQAMRSFPVR